MAPTRDEVIAVLKTINDPEILIDIWTLGLIYDINIEGNAVSIRMTFTSIGCPAGPYLVEEVQEKLKAVAGVEQVQVEVVFNPPWEPSEELKGLLGIM
jgi:metal-sulfur cluster biosynthetic enzyme